MTDPLANAAGPGAPSVAPHRRLRPDGLAERLAALAGRVAISSGSEPPDPVVSPLDGSPLGVFAWRPPTALVLATSRLLAGGAA